MLQFDIVKHRGSIIKVIGVGGGGSNAVTYMYKQGITGVDFAICNTDNQSLELSPVPTKIQLGPNLTEGRGAGSRPEVGKKACLESIEEVKTYLSNGCKMLFVTAGMGGGTGTGAAPIIAKAAKEMDILTVGIVTLPFAFEGRKRTDQGFEGLNELKKNVDTIIVISNDKLRDIYGNLAVSEAFAKADDVLTIAAKGIAEIVTVPGYVNVDFEDVNTVMREGGVAIMGTAMGEGEKRALKAVDGALSSPLLEDNNIQGAKHILVHIAYGSKEATMDEISEITNFVQDEAGHNANLIWGNSFDDAMGEKLAVTVIATGFTTGMETIEDNNQGKTSTSKGNKIVVSLEDTISNNTYTTKQTNTDSNTNTFEFDDITISNKPQTSNPIKQQESSEYNTERRTEKKMVLTERPNIMKLTNPNVMDEMENTPSYKRKNILLDDQIQPSDAYKSVSEKSKYRVSSDGELQQNDNPFLNPVTD